MLALVLLLSPLIESAPQPLHSHDPPPSCDTTICRVSDKSLDSALSTFLCFTKEETSAMEEIDKKRELAASITPYLAGFREEELVAMGSESLVSIVNLVLHVGSDKVVKKPKRQHLEDLINNIANAGVFGVSQDFFKNVDPILLGLINCQTKTIAEIHQLVAHMAGEERAGRGAFFDAIQQKFMGGFKVARPGDEYGGALDKLVQNWALGMKDLPRGLLDGMQDLPSMFQKAAAPTTMAPTTMAPTTTA